jgi:tetratricopeptide (TPR) repeat protein
MLLVSQFGKEHHLFKAHGKALQGMLFVADEQPTEAQQAFEESAGDYRDLAGDWRGAESVCLYCLGIIAGDAGDFADARRQLESALEYAKLAISADTTWAAEIERETRALAEQQVLIDALSRASSPSQVREAAAAIPGVAGTRTLTILRAMALTAGARGRVQDGLTLANAADWLAREVGEKIQRRANLAEAALYMNEYSLAEALYRTLLEESPDDLDIRAKLGRCLAEQGYNEEAKEHLTQVLGRSPDHARALRDLGGVYLNLGDFGAARRYFQAAAEADPSDPLPATVLKQLENHGAEPLVLYDPASKQLQIDEGLLSRPPDEVSMIITATLLRADPEGAAALLQSIAEERGLEYARRLAEMAFPPATKRDPSHQDKAEQLFAARKIPEALEEYRLAIAENRDDAFSYMGAGDCYYHMGRFSLAAAFFEESVAIQPRPSTLRFLGDAYRKTGHLKKAASAYEQAVQLDPSYTVAKEQLAVLRKHMEQGRV